MPHPASPWTPAQQARSRRTEERIVAAALELLDERTFDSLTIAEIAARAGVSVGGFYARFTSKEALLDYLNHSLLDGLSSRILERFTPEATRDDDARSLVAAYVSTALEAFRENRVVLRAVALRSRASSDEDFRTRIREFNRGMHDVFRERLAERAPECSHPDPAVAVDVALTAVSGAMREYVLFPDQRPDFASIDDGRLATELTNLFCSHLGVR